MSTPATTPPKVLAPHRQRKALGQVFLEDPAPVHQIASTIKEWGVDRVIEIGPGDGRLTRGLLAADLKVTAIEVDPRFASYLDAWRQTLPPDVQPRLEVVQDDATRLRWDQLLSEMQEPVAICGNLPYQVSSALILKLMPLFDQMTPGPAGMMFMVQKEFADRLTSSPGSKSYGSLSVFTQLRSTPRYEGFVSRHAFKPVPKVDSALVSLRPLAQPWTARELKDAERLCRASFALRRKKLRNSLKPWLRQVESPSIDLDLRPEVLNPEDFIRLGRELS